MRPRSPPKAWMCGSTPAPHSQARPTHPRRHRRTILPTDGRHPPSGALRVRLQQHTPARDPTGPHPRAEPGRPRASSPGTLGPQCPTCLPPHRRPRAAAGFGRQRRRPEHPPPPPARPPPPPPPTVTRTLTPARGPMRAHPASAPSLCGMRRPPLPLPLPRRVAVAARRRDAARHAASPSLLCCPPLPPPPPAATAAPGRHDPPLGRHSSGARFFPPPPPSRRADLSHFDPALGGDGAPETRRPARDAAKTRRAVR